MKILKSYVGMACATVLEIANLLTVKYDSSVFMVVMVALLGLAGYEVKKG